MQKELNFYWRTRQGVCLNWGLIRTVLKFIFKSSFKSGRLSIKCSSCSILPYLEGRSTQKIQGFHWHSYGFVVVFFGIVFGFDFVTKLRFFSIVYLVVPLTILVSGSIVYVIEYGRWMLVHCSASRQSTLSQRKSIFRDITWNVAWKTWYYAEYFKYVFHYISCYIAEIWISFLTV